MFTRAEEQCYVHVCLIENKLPGFWQCCKNRNEGLVKAYFLFIMLWKVALPHFTSPSKQMLDWTEKILSTHSSIIVEVGASSSLKQISSPYH